MWCPPFPWHKRESVIFRQNKSTAHKSAPLDNGHSIYVCFLGTMGARGKLISLHGKHTRRISFWSLLEKLRENSLDGLTIILRLCCSALASSSRASGSFKLSLSAYRRAKALAYFECAHTLYMYLHLTLSAFSSSSSSIVQSPDQVRAFTWAKT